MHDLILEGLIWRSASGKALGGRCGISAVACATPLALGLGSLNGDQ